MAWRRIAAAETAGHAVVCLISNYVTTLDTTGVGLCVFIPATCFDFSHAIVRVNTLCVGHKKGMHKLLSLELISQVIHNCAVYVVLQIGVKIDSSNGFLKMKAAISKVPAATLSPSTNALPTGNDLETEPVSEEIRD
jgi:hypothetical protein